MTNMLLTELTGVKKFHKYDEYQISKLLRRFGVKLIGAGRYGKVFTHDKWDYVVKIFSDDYSYLEFVNFAIKHPNKHFPKFKRSPLEMHAFHTRRSTAPDGFWVVKIEKLKEITDKNLVKFLVANTEDGMIARFWVSGNKDQLKYYHEKSPDVKRLLPDGSYEANISYADLFDRYPWFASFCDAVKILSENDIGVNDLRNDGNYMQRADGTIVIIDPAWAGWNPYQAAREYMDVENDRWGGGEDDYHVSGPDYAIRKKSEEERLAKKAEEAAKKLIDQMDDDIPF